jgi:hypothetical protein
VEVALWELAVVDGKLRFFIWIGCTLLLTRTSGLGPRGAPEGIAMRSHSVALPTGAALIRQDPALDSNNGGPVTAGRNYRGVRGRGPSKLSSIPLVWDIR